jgi:cyclopropane fatty-acyl-phospholipid synthase-like methyltransferase
LVPAAGCFDPANFLRPSQDAKGVRMTYAIGRAIESEPHRSPHAQAVIDYYRHTEVDYRIVWQNRRNLAYHFGYFDLETRSHAEALENTNQTLAKLAGIGLSDKVLDAGCGTGGSSFWIAANCGAKVVGVNLMSSAIVEARRIALERGLHESVHFDHADYTALPYKDGSFDVVWALESLCHAPSKLAFYREAARVLRPGGRLVLAEYMRRCRDLPPEDERMMRTWLDGWAIPDLDTSVEHVWAAKDAGFKCIYTEDFTPRARRSLRRLYHRAIAAIPINALLYAFGQRNAVQRANVISSFLQYRALQRNAWYYGVLTATRK